MEADELVRRLNALPRPVCAELTPFDVTVARQGPAYIEVVFEPQPAFGNHFGHVQGGFAVAMLDALLSLAVFIETDTFLPTVSITSHFLAPLPIGEVTGQGRVLRRGSSLVFAEASLWSKAGRLAVQATGIAAGPPSGSTQER